MKLFEKFFLVVVCIGLITSFIGVQPAYAAVISVNSNVDDTLVNLDANTTCDLREAITNANDNASTYSDCAPGGGADIISFAANYTITLLGSQLPVVSSQITILGNGAANTVVQANAAANTATYRVFEVNGAGNLTLDGLTVRNGRCNGSCATSLNIGGGILVQNGALAVTNSALSNNNAVNGGGIYIVGGTADIQNSMFSGNSASSNGGGMYIESVAITIKTSNFSGNSADYGGGLYTYFGPTDVENSTFSGNSAVSNGSALVAGTAACAGANVQIRSTTITAGGGGASAVYVAPIICIPATLTMSNSIVARSGETQAFEIGGGSGFLDNGNNLSNFATGTPAGVSINASLGLGPLADNGGPTRTHALLASSPAIDAGANCVATDQRGVSRPQGAGCDIGAFEVDDTFPTVVSDSLVASYASGAGPGSFTVTFSENAYDPAGNINLNDVTNPVNYLLVEDGVNNLFNTGSCAGGLVSDDVQTAITSVAYNAGLFTSTITLPAALPDGSYRLFVCGTTSILDLASRELNDGLSDYTFNFTVGTVTQTVPSTTFSPLPATGFAPHKVTSLPAQPAHLAYTTMSDIWLEIPSQNIKTNIVGVSQAENKTWDVKWLENNVGWLNGTAFPTWTGNSVLTAHVTNANGLPGPFANIKDLKYGDQLIVHLYGQSYIFEVRTSVPVRSGINAYAFQHLEEASYLTLITCQSYDEQTDSYRFRRIVRAVLVSIENQ